MLKRSTVLVVGKLVFFCFLNTPGNRMICTHGKSDVIRPEKTTQHEEKRKVSRTGLQCRDGNDIPN